MKTYALSAYLQRFFTERLGAQMKASQNTVASYRDTFRLLLLYAADERKKEPTALQVADIDADLVAQFLTDLEKTRGNGARSRNTRLAAIRSFFKYVAVNEPQLLHHCQRVLAMPAKRHEKRAIDYLDRDEIEAVIAAPDLSTWHGRRDRAILLLTLQTGLRVTELITLTCDDIALGSGAHVRCMGKGRKERATPIRKDSIKLLRDWLAERKGKAISTALDLHQRSRYPQPARAPAAAAMPWRASFAGTSIRHRRHANPCARNASRRTFFATARRCNSCTAASTVR